MHAVAEYASWLSQDTYAVDSTRRAVRSTHPTHSNMPGASSSSSTNTIKTGDSYYGTDMVERGRSLTGVGSFSSFEPPINPFTVDPVFPRCGSVPPSSGVPVMFKTGNCFRGSSTARAAVSQSHNRDLRGPEAGSSSDFSINSSRHAASVPSSRCRSPVFKYEQPPARLSSVSSLPDDVSRNRRVLSPEASISSDFMSLHDRSSVNDVGDDVRYSRSCSGTVEQSATSRKRQRPPTGNSSSLLFAKKLAKLRELRYTHAKSRCST